jgi:hypothetical protein
MAQTLYWVVCDTINAGYGNDDASAVRIQQGRNAAAALLPAGQVGNLPAPAVTGTVPAGVAATGLTPGASYTIAWTIWDGVSGTSYGGGTSTKVVLSAPFNALNGTVYPVARAESVALTDAQNSAAIFLASRAESVALTDSQNFGATTYTVARAETVALTDSSTGVTVGGTVYPVARAESIALSDSTTGVLASTDCDPFFTKVVLLQHFDNSLLATVGGQFLTDGSVTMSQTNARWDYSVNINGNPVPPGTGGANVVYSATNSATWDLNATDFTIEGWMWMNSAPDRPRTLISIEDSSNQREEYSIYVDGAPTNNYRFMYPTDALNTAGIAGPAIQLNTWVFLAYRRTGNTYEAFVNGVPVLAGPVTNAYRRPAGLKDVLEGNSHRSFVDALDGIIDDVRVTTVARSLTTVPTGPFPDFQCAPIVLGSVSESVTLADGQTATVSSAGINTVIDTISIVDTEVARAIFNVGRSESFTLTDSQTGTTPGIQTGTVNESFTLTDRQTGQVDAGLCPGLPPGWVMTKVLENVPNPNFGTPYGQTYFTRWTYITTDENGQFVCASGADTDCCAQSHAMAEQRTQQQPYNEAI